MAILTLETSKQFVKSWGEVSSTENTFLTLAPCNTTASFFLDNNDAYISSQAWSITTGADGNFTFYPERRGPNELRGCLPSFLLHSLGTVAVAKQKGGIAPSRSGRHENDLRPRYRDSYADEYDSGNRDRDYTQSPPSRSRRRNSYANDYHPGDTYDNDPEPPPSRSRRRYSYANVYDRGTRYWDYPESFRYPDPSRDTFARSCGPGYWNRETTEIPQYRDHSYARNSDRWDRTWHAFELPVIYSTSNEYSRNRYRDAPLPPWANHASRAHYPSWDDHYLWAYRPSERTQLGIRPWENRIWGFFRSFLIYALT